MKLRFLIVYIAAVSITPIGLGQTIGIDWFTIDAGGGGSAGGQYGIFGALGQPDVGFSRGGQYSIGGGFVSPVNLVQTPSAPKLEVERVNGTISVFWTLPAKGWLLEQSTTLTGAWTKVLFPYNTNGSRISISIQAPGASSFYRLTQ